MDAAHHPLEPDAKDEDSRTNSGGIVQMVRALPIRWRIFAIAALNSVVVVIIAGLIWSGANALSSSWDQVRQVRESDRVLALLESEAGRLQTLIHRYINQPSPDIFAEILLLREAVLSTLRTRAPGDNLLSSSAPELEGILDRFLNGFGELRALQSTIARTYDEDVQAPAKEMTGLYAILDSGVAKRDSLIWPSLGKSREAFSATLVAANSFYLSPDSEAAEDARRNIETIERTIPVMSDLAENDFQRIALERLGERAASFKAGLAKLASQFANRTELLQTAIDANQAAMIASINRLSMEMRQHEEEAQEQFDETLLGIYRNVGGISLIFLLLIMLAGFVTAVSIRQPLREIMASMNAIAAGDYDRPIQGTAAKDEAGDMARAIEVFRENAIAKQRADAELLHSKEQAEGALKDLRTARRDLLDAERLAALGGLVAGVAHEVNNPIGVSLTVASSFARRCDLFNAELKDGPLRRSRLEEFIEGSRDASQQLVTNLQHAAELIQSFKQVAVDRSHVDRRQFHLAEATDQIASSLRPVLKKASITLGISIPEGIVLDSFPGSYGQVLTNLFLNAVTHAFPDGQSGQILIEARRKGGDTVDIIIYDDGVGMTPDIQRQAFDPFFTTRRSQGGTGLGLHIVFNIVTQRLGGRLTLNSTPGLGTTFRITIPLVAPRETSVEAIYTKAG